MKRGLNPAIFVLLCLFLIAVLAGGYWYFFVYIPVEGTITPSYELFVSECLEAVEDYSAWLQARSEGAGACNKSSRFRKPFCLASVTQDSVSCADAAPDTTTACNAIASNDKTACDDPYCLAYLGDDSGCEQLGLERFACKAAVRGDSAYFSSEKAKSDCQDIALNDWAITKHDKSICERISDALLKDDCLSALLR